MHRHLGATLACVVALAAARPAVAEESQETRKERSRALWAEGAARYDVGKFKEAIRLFLDAYEIWPFPDILFNLCQAHRQLKEFERAAFYCRSFLRNSPDVEAEQRDIVIELVEQMDRTIEAQRSTKDRPPDGVERPPGGAPRHGATTARLWYDDPLAWIVTGAGTAGLAVGVGFLYSAAGLREDAGDALTEFDRTRLRGEAESREEIGIPVAIGGGVVLAAGVFLLVWNPSRAPVPVVEVTDDAAWLGLRGRF